MRLELKMSHIMRGFLLILLVIVIGVVFYLDLFSLGYIRSAEIEKEGILLGNMVRIWDNTLENNQIFIDNYMSSNKSTVALNTARTQESTLYAMQDIRTDLHEYSMLNYGMQEIFFYSGKVGDDGYLTSYRNKGDRTRMMKIQIREVIDMCVEHNNVGIWSVENWNGQNFLIYIVERNGDYMGCWASLDYLLEELTRNGSQVQESEACRFFISNFDGECLTSGYLEGETVDLWTQNYTDGENNVQYIQVVKFTEVLPINFVEHIEMSSMEAGVIYVRNIMILIGIALVLSIAVWSGILEHILYRPIRNLMANMSQFSEGNLDTRIDEKSRLREIHLLYKSFNDMAHEIQNLKIALYEKEINEQKTKLEYLQIQIHPHFLVNGLNSIRAMIDMNKEIPAKKMCSYLADYYRYQYQGGSGLLPLQNEIEHVETYINIQKMRHSNKVEFYCEVDDSSKLTLVPPILILTFVGNSFKYGMNLKNFKHIIFLTITDQGDSTHICVRDEGAGFSEAVLEQIQADIPIVQQGRVCIGIQNAFNRLKLFYGDKSSYRAYNDNGAVVEIEIPTRL